MSKEDHVQMVAEQATKKAEEHLQACVPEFADLLQESERDRWNEVRTEVREKFAERIRWALWLRGGA